MKEFRKEMENVYTTSVHKETLDESPQVYRDSEMIKMLLSDTVDIREQLKPIINVKALT
jgi:hypothetical protein